MVVSIILNDDIEVPDIQLWYKHQLPIQNNEKFVKINFIDYSKTPVYLLHSGLIDVYSNSQTTEQYFIQNLLRYSGIHNGSKNKLGILAKSMENENLYLILLIQDQKIKALILDFTILQKLDSIEDEGEVVNNYIMDFKSRSSDVNIFDKVLEKKRHRSKSVTPKEPQVQQSADQINSMISRVISSGLRLRGLTTNAANSSNEKVKLKEIYSMTYKSTSFALRKFGNKPIELNDVQDIVESLLQIFVDVDQDPSTNPFIE